MTTGVKNSTIVFHSILHSASQISYLINMKESVQETVVTVAHTLNGLSFHLKTSIITLYILFMVFYYCCFCWYQQLHCRKNYSGKHPRNEHDSKGGTDAGIIIYDVQSVFRHKFAQVCKNLNEILFPFSYHFRLLCI